MDGEKTGPGPKISVIIGPPGTGKTETLSTWAARAASRYGFDRVMVCSLTRTGAREAARRIELPVQQMGTVHAFAYRALGSPVMAESKIKEWNEAHPEMEMSSHSATADDAYNISDELTPVDLAKLEVSRLRTLGRDPLLAPNIEVSAFHEKWEDWKKQCGYLDFVDLVDLAYTDVEKAPGEPAVIMNDESQDTGPAEMRLLFKWAKHAEHFVLGGDFAQALFSFRGSDPLLLQRLWHEHDRSRKPLQQSYRLSQAVYQFAYEWARRFTQTERVSFLPRPDAPGELCFEPGTRFDTITPHTVEQLVEDYGQGDGTSAMPLMFLASCGYMLEPLIKALRQVGIPFCNPWRPNHGGWNPLPQGRSRGLTIIDRVLAFVRPLPEVWGEQARFWTAQDLKAWAGGLPATGIFTRGGVSQIQAVKDAASDEEIAGAFTKWFLPEARAHMAPKPDLGWYLGQVKGSDRLRDFVGEVVARSGAATLRERPKVAVGTVHSTKGAEAATVVLCPDVSLQAWQAAQETEEAREELRRVFYVGITRARQRLVLCGAGSRYAVRW